MCVCLLHYLVCTYYGFALFWLLCFLIILVALVCLIFHTFIAEFVSSETLWLSSHNHFLTPVCLSVSFVRSHQLHNVNLSLLSWFGDCNL